MSSPELHSAPRSLQEHSKLHGSSPELPGARQSSQEFASVPRNLPEHHGPRQRSWELIRAPRSSPENPGSCQRFWALARALRNLVGLSGARWSSQEHTRAPKSSPESGSSTLERTFKHALRASSSGAEIRQNPMKSPRLLEAQDHTITTKFLVLSSAPFNVCSGESIHIILLYVGAPKWGKQCT